MLGLIGREVKLDQPSDVDISGREWLGQAGKPDGAPRYVLAKLLELPFEPALELLGRHGNARKAADCELSHDSIVRLGHPAGNGRESPFRTGAA
jgi:hypothetical protein